MQDEHKTVRQNALSLTRTQNVCMHQKCVPLFPLHERKMTHDMIAIECSLGEASLSDRLGEHKQALLENLQIPNGIG